MKARLILIILLMALPAIGSNKQIEPPSGRVEYRINTVAEDAMPRQIFEAIGRIDSANAAYYADPNEIWISRVDNRRWLHMKDVDGTVLTFGPYRAETDPEFRAWLDSVKTSVAWRGLLFEGRQEYAECRTATGLPDSNEARTIVFWWNPGITADIQAKQCLVAMGEDNDGFTLEWYSGHELILHLKPNLSNARISFAAQLPDIARYPVCIILTYSGIGAPDTSDFRLSISGGKLTGPYTYYTGPIPSLLTRVSRIRIGAPLVETWNNPLTGGVTQVAIYNRVWSQAEVDDYFYDRPANIASHTPSGLVSYWRMRTAVGDPQTIRDEVGANDLTLGIGDGDDYRDPRVTSTAPVWTPDVFQINGTFRPSITLGVNARMVYHADVVAADTIREWTSARDSLGVAWIREGAGIAWSEVDDNESDRGAFTPDSRVDDLFAAKPAGMHLLAIAGSHADSTVWPVYQPHDAASEASFKAYVIWLVNRYKNDVDVWEVWNEPNLPMGTPATGTYKALPVSDLARVIRIVNTVVDSLDTGAKVIGPCCYANANNLSAVDAYEDSLKLTGADTLLDAISFHYYPQGYGGPDTWDGYFTNGLHTYFMNLRERWPGKEVWCTEIGATDESIIGQSGQILHILNEMEAYGVDYLMWWNIRDYSGHGVDAEYNCGLLETSWIRKVAGREFRRAATGEP